jgi:membrane protease YdiL (CAAX protease family)
MDRARPGGPWRGLLPRLAAVGGLAGVVALLAWLARGLAAAGGRSLRLGGKGGAGHLTVMALALAAVAAFAHLVWRRPLPAVLRRGWRRRRRATLELLAAGAIAAGATTAVYLVVAGLGGFEAGRPLAELARPALLLALARYAGRALAVAAVEEIVFRGFLLGYLRVGPDRAAGGTAVVLSTLLFAASHAYRDAEPWLGLERGPALVGLALLGGFLGCLYLRSGSLALPTGAHAGMLLVSVTVRKTRVLRPRPSAWWLARAGDLRGTLLGWALLGGAALALWARRAPGVVELAQPGGPASLPAGLSTNTK